MILLFPLPGYVAKLVQDVQVVRLKKTDARVETVSEGVYSPTSSMICLTKVFL